MGCKLRFVLESTNKGTGGGDSLAGCGEVGGVGGDGGSLIDEGAGLCGEEERIPNRFGFVGGGGGGATRFLKSFSVMNFGLAANCFWRSSTFNFNSAISASFSARPSMARVAMSCASTSDSLSPPLRLNRE